MAICNARCVISLRLLLLHPTLMSLISLGLMVFSYSYSKSPSAPDRREASLRIAPTDQRTDNETAFERSKGRYADRDCLVGASSAAAF